MQKEPASFFSGAFFFAGVEAGRKLGRGESRSRGKVDEVTTWGSIFFCVCYSWAATGESRSRGKVDEGGEGGAASLFLGAFSILEAFFGMAFLAAGASGGDDVLLASPHPLSTCQ